MASPSARDLEAAPWRPWWPAVALKWEPRDLWVGVYWDSHSWRADPEVGMDSGWYLEVYICLVPLLPVRLRFGDAKTW